MKAINSKERPLFPGVTCQVEFHDLLWNFTARRKGRRLAHAWCTPEGDALQIMDFEVHRELVTPSNPLLPQFFAVKRQLRRRGIGSALMRFVIETATEKNMTRISGEVADQDLEEFAGLMEWLEEFGFKRLQPDITDPFKTIWMIELGLPHRERTTER